MRVGARPDTEPVAVAPVPKVVEATLPSPRPIGDLVVAISGAREHAFRELVHPGETGVAGLRRGRGDAPAFEDRPTTPGPVRDGRLRIEAQLERVAGDVIRVQRDCCFEVACPARDRLARPAEDEVEVQVEPGVAGHADRGRAVLRLVGPTERPQPARVKALRAERETRQAEGQPSIQARPIQGGRIRLERHLAGPEDERIPQRVAEHHDLRRLEEARGSATEEERADAWTTEEVSLPRDLAAERLQVARAEGRRRRRGSEIAVRAPRSTEGYVHVEADPPGHRVTPNGFGRSASAESSAVRPRSMSHSRDSCTNARRWLGLQSVSATIRSSPKSGRSST